MEFSVSNGRLLDGNGAAFVMRGVNYPYAWYTSRYPAGTRHDLAAVRAMNANCVRIVLGSGAQYRRTSGEEIAALVRICRQEHLVAILEVHDCTGYGDLDLAPNAVPITHAVAYWLSSDVLEAVRGQEAFVIINIANEPFGNRSSAHSVRQTIDAIGSLRSAGLQHTLMIDAANWGQDWSGATRKAAAKIFNADALQNTVISVHMYEVYEDVGTISRYLAAYRKAGIPLVIGEFGPSHLGVEVDEGSIMLQAQKYGLGYLGWCWSGNSPEYAELDIVHEFGSSLSAWGETLVNGRNGIRETAIAATIFGAPDGLYGVESFSSSGMQDLVHACGPNQSG